MGWNRLTERHEAGVWQQPHQWPPAERGHPPSYTQLA
jgi:hypothetical protein